MSECDQEELIVTRKLNGLDDNLYIDGNDANVGSIEEDIKKVKELNNLLKFFKIHGWIPDMSRELNTNATIEAIEHLLSYYTRQKQINEEYKKENGLLKEKVKELEKENQELLEVKISVSAENTIQKLKRENIKLEERCFIAEGNLKTTKEELRDYFYNSITKQKIKDKIEELDRKIRYEQNERALIHLYKQRKILTELLEKREETNE